MSKSDGKDNTKNQANHDEIKTQLKGVDKITLHLNFCFAPISAAKHRIFKILVPTPHNIPLIMGGIEAEI